MKKYRLTNSIENPIPSAKNLMYLSHVLSKWKWFFLVLTIVVVGFVFYRIGKYVGMQSKPKTKKKHQHKSTKYTESDDQAPRNDTSSSDSPL